MTDKQYLVSYNYNKIGEFSGIGELTLTINTKINFEMLEDIRKKIFQTLKNKHGEGKYTIAILNIVSLSDL